MGRLGARSEPEVQIGADFVPYGHAFGSLAIGSTLSLSPGMWLSLRIRPVSAPSRAIDLRVGTLLPIGEACEQAGLSAPG